MKGSLVGVPKLPFGKILLALALVPGVYLTLALAAALSLAAGGGAAYSIYYMVTHGHRLPGRAVLLGALVVVGALIGVYAVLKGVIASFRRPAQFEPSLFLRASDDPELAQTIQRICADIGCPPPNALLLDPTPDFSARQSKVQALNGACSGRVLTVSLPLMGVLTVDEMRAIIAHEMAHFTGRDTLYTVRVLPVYMGLGASLQGLSAAQQSQGDDSGCYGCALQLPLLLPTLILRVYLVLFALLDSSIRRVREQRADAMAVNVVGRDVFASALRKVVRVGNLFEEYLEREVKRPSRPDASEVNHFVDFQRTVAESHDRLDALEQEAMAREGDTLDHHPALSVRLQALPEVPGGPEDSRLARALLQRADEYEAKLNEIIRAVVARGPLVIDGPAASGEDGPSPEAPQ